MKQSEIRVGMMVEVLNPRGYGIDYRIKNGTRAVVLIIEKYDDTCYVEVYKIKLGHAIATGYTREIRYQDLEKYKVINGTQWWT